MEVSAADEKARLTPDLCRERTYARGRTVERKSEGVWAEQRE